MLIGADNTQLPYEQYFVAGTSKFPRSIPAIAKIAASGHSVLDTKIFKKHYEASLITADSVLCLNWLGWFLRRAIMTVQHENRSAKDRRLVELHFSPSTFIDRRWHKDPRFPAMDEDDIDDPDWGISDSELEQNGKIFLDD